MSTNCWPSDGSKADRAALPSRELLSVAAKEKALTGLSRAGAGVVPGS